MTERLVTVQDIQSALRDASYAMASPISLHAVEVDPLKFRALGYLTAFLTEENTIQNLKRHLETLQRPPEDSSLETISKEILCVLYKNTISSDYTQRRRFDRHVWTSVYRGISNRGSYVYDLNKDVASEKRIYVRRDKNDGQLRGELSEDDFEKPRFFEPEKPKPLPLSNEPVSATMKWWQRLQKRWQEL